ncbi:MAG: hypothetical protein Q4G39_05290 [Brachymonas sp.]|nr:hypothetical protein [Brachymonas sp.]
MLYDYVIRSSQPEVCVEFYTTILGLKPKGFRRRKNNGNNNGVAPAVGQQAAPGNGAGAPMQMFRITHTHITSIKPEVNKSRKGANHAAEPSASTAEERQELYFMTRYPLADIHARLKNAQLPGKAHFPLTHLKGSATELRILQISDPDGNRLRLVEFA